MRSEEGANKDPLKELKDQFNTKRLTLNVHENASNCELEKMEEARASAIPKRPKGDQPGLTSRRTSREYSKRTEGSKR
jgi:hypothetical protein